MPDYQSNAKKSKEQQSEKVTPDKHIEKVVTGEVIVQKKSLGRKFRDVIVLADFGSVVKYLGRDVLLPGIRNMIMDTGTEGLRRMLYGEDAARRRNLGGGTRVTFPYNNPINRGYSDISTRYNPRSMPPDPRERPTREDFLLSSREEAELVVTTMNDVIDQWDIVTVADLNELLGVPKTYVDNRWGWTHLGHVPIRQIREGYLIDFPPAEPIQ